MDRIIGDFSAGRPGPTLLTVGGLHGSEPAGVHAATQVLSDLASFADTFQGRFLACRGNLKALEAGRRYIDVDLNRIWQADEVERLLQGRVARDDRAEHLEARALSRLLHSVLQEADQSACLLDLHTTSSESPPFFWLIDSPDADRHLPNYGLPIVWDPRVGVRGTLAQYVASLGNTVMLAEGGQHDAPVTVKRFEAILWVTLVELGCLSKEAVGHRYTESMNLLREACGGLPMCHEIVHDHKITEEDGFEMSPGFKSFQWIERGQPLAMDRNGAVLAPLSGWILMPLYRPPCDTGFVIVQERKGLLSGARRLHPKSIR